MPKEVKSRHSGQANLIFGEAHIGSIPPQARLGSFNLREGSRKGRQQKPKI
jgi:hypothetical protein